MLSVCTNYIISPYLVNGHESRHRAYQTIVMRQLSTIRSIIYQMSLQIFNCKFLMLKFEVTLVYLISDSTNFCENANGHHFISDACTKRCLCVCMCMPMYEQVCAIANRFECTHAHVENAT